MVTEIFLKPAPRAPGQSLAAVLRQANLPGEQLEKVSTAERRLKACELEQTTAVGTQPWTAYLKLTRNAGLEQRIAALERDDAAIRETDAAIWGEGYVRNVAAQALLLAVGAQLNAASSSHRFQQEALAGSSTESLY